VSLKSKLLTALYGGAIAFPVACADTVGPDDEEGWDVGEEDPGSMSQPTNNGNPTTGNKPDPCDLETLDELPFPGWREAFQYGEIREGTYRVCATAQAACTELDEGEIQELVTSVINGPDECRVDAWYSGDEVCGPTTMEDGRCCYAIPLTFSECVVGRPFDVDGEVRTGGLGAAEGWRDELTLEYADLPPSVRSRIAAAWAEAGEHEHASIASFSRFLLDLMALGAPRRLIEATTRAIDDEVRHAAACFGIASAYAGEPLSPGPIDIRGAAATGDARAALVAAIREGCVGETLAAALAEWQAPRAASPVVRDALRAIAEEEGAHAWLAWDFVRWLLRERPELVDVARRAFDDLAIDPQSPWAAGFDHDDLVLMEHGVLSPAVADQLRRHAFDDVVRPCAEALFAACQ